MPTPLDIRIVQGHRPPPNPGGITVVIDVIRAFTTAHEAFRGGARRIHLVSTAEQALALKTAHPEWLLAGEIEALPIPGFDFGNSPWEIRHADVNGRDLVQRTTNGVIATLAARDSAAVLVGSLLNARATARWILGQPAAPILLVASHPDGEEDVACAQWLCQLLGTEGIDHDTAAQRTLDSRAAQKFLRGDHPRLRAEDIRIAASDAGDQGLVMAADYGEALPCLHVIT